LPGHEQGSRYGRSREQPDSEIGDRLPGRIGCGERQHNPSQSDRQ
jgi:hypothetical protein